MSLFDFIVGKTKRTIEKHYKKGDKVKLISFFVKTHDKLVCLDLEGMADAFRRRDIRYADIRTSVIHIEVIEETIIGPDESIYVAKLEGDDIVGIRYLNTFSYLGNPSKSRYWYPSSLPGHYIDYAYTLSCIKLDVRIPKKLIKDVKAL